jgi:coenzyme F420-0:L-glutamate ligase / coenzyme F420-1:gamma-L-glutamate ligase
LKQISIIGLQTIPEIKPGDNLVREILDSCKREQLELNDNDIVIITSKIISKAENSLVQLSSVVPTKRSKAIARLTGKDPVEVEIILGQSKEIAAVIPVKKIMKHYPEIVESISEDKEAAARAVENVPSMLLTLTHQGILATDAGLDYSNNELGNASLLPKDSDESAKKIRKVISDLCGKDVAVVVTDTELAYTDYFGSKEVAIGFSGIRPVSNKFGSKERFGREKFGGADVIVDELANAAALLEGQTSEGIPVVIVRGLAYDRGGDNRVSFSPEIRRKGIRWTVLATLKMRFARLIQPFV